jgi:hypothetical protein
MKAKEFVPASKPRNFVAKNAQTSGAGKHRDSDKKKDQEQGKVKHKKDLIPMEDVAEATSAAVRMQRAADRQRAKSDASLARTPSSIPKKQEPKKKDVAERVRDPEDWDEGNTEPPNNFAVYINGKKWKVFKGRGQFAGDYKEIQHHRQLQNWAQAKSAATGKEWKVYVTGETATEGIEEANVNPQFIIAQITKILAGEARRMTNAPMAQLLAPVMKEYGLTLQQIDAMIPGGLKKAAGEYGIMMKEGWSDAYVARRTGRPRTPYSVYIKGKKWKDFENDDHAEAVANKLKAKFKADGRDPTVITIAPTEIITGEATALEKFRKAADEREKKHDAAEKEMKARHARGEEDMKGSIDRLEKHVNNK